MAGHFVNPWFKTTEFEADYCSGLIKLFTAQIRMIEQLKDPRALKKIITCVQAGDMCG